MTSARPTPQLTSPPAAPPRRPLDKRARIALPLCAAALFGLAIHRLIVADPTPTPYAEFSGPTMGTLYSVKVASPELDAGPARAALLQAIQAQLEMVDALMSTYRPDSELSRFNRHASLDPFPVSVQTLEVFRIAQRVSEMTDGAFDITVGPLVAAWGFGATQHLPAPPSALERLELRRHVGYQKLSIDPQRRTLAKADPRVECDLSAIAKGFAVDRVAQAIADLGHANYLVEVGGELRAHGVKPGGLAWRVGIERPDAATRVSHDVVILNDAALATSGDYRDYYEIDGERVSHTLDPRAGHPIKHNLASVSVLHARAVWADALATALNVMGPQDGLAWAEAHEIAALFLIREPDGGFQSVETAAFAELREPR